MLLPEVDDLRPNASRLTWPRCYARLVQSAGPAPSRSASSGTTITLAQEYGFRLRGASPAVERYSDALDFYRDYDEVWAINDARIVALDPKEPGSLATMQVGHPFH
ncbi:hypothetical protein [Streptomyces sp. NPDC059071]|uniref:hypothetical protein n=1 Tax=unclassified Streptomyces TaxID=2593676 RepID=UPI00365A9AC2